MSQSFMILPKTGEYHNYCIDLAIMPLAKYQVHM